MFDFGKLDSKTMAAFKESSAKMDVKRSGLKVEGIVSTEVRRFPCFIFLSSINLKGTRRNLYSCNLLHTS